MSAASLVARPAALGAAGQRHCRARRPAAAPAFPRNLVVCSYSSDPNYRRSASPRPASPASDPNYRRSSSQRPSSPRPGFGGGGGSSASRLDRSQDPSYRRSSSPRPTSPRPGGGSAPGGNGGVAPPGREQVQEAITSNPLFTSQFMGVLQDSLARQGSQALTSVPPAEPRASATEEVLTAALAQSKQTLQQMTVWRDQLDRHIIAQQKQVDRMEFALNKSIGDAAYMRALKEMMHGDM